MASGSPEDGAAAVNFAIAHQRPKSSFRGCSRIGDYEVLGKLGEGTFGEVHRARSRKTNAIVALKKIIMHHEKDGFPITSLREIRLLKLLSHKNVVHLEDMAVEHSQRPSDKRKKPIMHMVMPYLDHDLSGLLDNPSVHFTEPQIKCYMLQLLEGLRYLHDRNILHRDMKAANLLINNQGILQIADFGLARFYEGPRPKPGQAVGEGRREYTGLVVTRWYRPPELLLNLKRYTTAIDVWGVGCVFGEMLSGKPILAGESDAHQLEIIWDLVGSPTEDNMPGWKNLPGAEVLSPRPRPGCLATRFREHGSGAISLLKDLLALNWKTRINAVDALQHPYFKMVPLPANPADLPTFEDSHEFDRRKFHDRRGVLPPAPKGGTVGKGPDSNGAAAGMNASDAYASRNGVSVPRYPGPGQGPGPRNGDERRPAWQRGERGLPPRPPPPERNGWDGDDAYRDRDRRAPSASKGARAPDVDTYIPSYGREREAGRPPREDGGRHRDERSRGEDWSSRGGERRRWEERERWHEGGGHRRTRSRSRSPVRERDVYRR
ncbi:related to cyclin dependent kinase C [Cephalotrichum gorgonifer]|uniref:Serine/threonine-protein kinase BUR1 n=1 Tax=Cephalotrichum gorgonifer TaxID=2041049 RepID=A0AAE8SR07_9PEZI|nr:related to cyclin dependent kinase C [Cephalotrichum gorgonifer]